MDFTGMLGGLLQQYAGGRPASAASAHDHFDQVAQGVDSSSLSSAIGSMMRSSDTPAFGQIAGQLFGSGDAGQKATMLNTLLAGAGPAALSQLAGIIPGFAANSAITPEQAQAVPPETVSQIAAHAEQHDPSILDRMSSVYAAHPTLVKTLGTGAMIIAMRELAKAMGPKES